MKVLSFVEGANPRRGGLGLVGVPRITESLAERGHQVVLNVGGRVSPGGERFVQLDVNTALQQKSGGNGVRLNQSTECTAGNCRRWRSSKIYRSIKDLPKIFWHCRSGCFNWPLIGRKKLEAFADADIFVLPSHAENFAFAMFEAMASRIPVVISNTLNFAPEVERYSGGLVVKRDSSSFLPVTKSLNTIPGLDPGLGFTSFIRTNQRLLITIAAS
jgi:glycosyltransferase involved in cell wall biosynthesis